MSTKRDIVEEIIDEYQNNDKAELEVRYYLEPTEWRNLYTQLLQENPDAPVKTEQSLHALMGVEDDAEKRGPTDRMEIYFEQGVKKQTKYIRKTTLRYLKLRGAKINLATEENRSEFVLTNAKMLRFRIRAMIPLENWRADFTIVKEIRQVQPEKIQQIKDAFFTKKPFKLPELPEWSGASEAGLRYEFEMEYVGDADVLTKDMLQKQITYIQSLINPGTENSEEYHKKLYDLATQLLGKDDAQMFRNRYSLKQLANQPKNFSYEEYQAKIVPHIENFYLSDKADGERCFLLVENNSIILLTSDKLVDITALLKKADIKKLSKDGPTLLDTEVLDLNSKDPKFSTIYLFDALIHNGKKVVKESFADRQALLDDIADQLGPKVEKKIQIRLSQTTAGKQIADMYHRKSRTYPIDGLIFTPADMGYFDMQVYKWKPPEKMTIDFLVMRPPKGLLGMKPYLPKAGYELYFLFSGVNYPTFRALNLDYIPKYKEIFQGYHFGKDYFPIQFAPSSNPFAYMYYHPLNSKIQSEALHGHVVEFRYNCLGDEMSNPDCTWILERLRLDRDINVRRGTGYGNDFKVAESTYQGYFNPLDLKKLSLVEPKESKNQPGLKNVEDAYFLESKLPIYRALTKFNGFVTAQLSRQLSDADFVVELGAGKGQNLFILNGYGVKNGLFIDVDKAAIETLNKRRYDLGDKRFQIHEYRPGHIMTVYSKVIDLNQPATKTIAAVQDVMVKYPQGADGVLINLAIHYLLGDKAGLDNIVMVVDKLLKPGGIFIFTCFNGARIVNLLKDLKPQESWNSKEGEVLKYSIRKEYKDTKETKEGELEEWGMKVGVIHPFSQGNYYTENLVPIEQVISAFTKRGYQIRQNGSYGDWLDKFQYANKKMYDLLTDADKLYASLYHSVSLWKPMEPPGK